MQNIPEVGMFCTSPRAGGPFQLMQSGAPLIRTLTDRQKANLSYWIYYHNLRYRLFDESPGSGEAPVVLDQDWVDAHRDRTPPASDRMLTFLREVIRSNDAGETPNTSMTKGLKTDLRMAAGGCRDHNDLSELYRYATAQGWMGAKVTTRFSNNYDIVDPNIINLSARIYVDEQLGVLGRSRQGFVAMWFDPCMEQAYNCGIAPALAAAGYEALRIDRKEFLGKVDDEIVAEIRKSRFVVADFTTDRKNGARGGVYYEAGFAHGRDIPVILTCRKDCMNDVHFDTNHFNHLIWETPEDMRRKLKTRIEATVGRGPLNPSNEQSGGAAAALNEDL